MLSLNHARSRPELMPTIESHKDVTMTSRLALSVQDVSLKEDVDLSEGFPLVFKDCDAQWMYWKDIGPFTSVRETLTHFQRA